MKHDLPHADKRPWRRGACAALLCAAGALLAACATQAPASSPTTAVVAASVDVQRTITGPIVLAFLPPEARNANVEGAGEAQAHVRFALADTQRCLGSRPVRFETVFANRLLLRDGARTVSFTPDAIGLGIGAVLIEPGRAGVMVQSTVGASSLQYQLPQAAFSYWGTPACRRD